MKTNWLSVFLLFLVGLLVLGRSLELDPDELCDHYAQEQMSTVCADPVRILLPTPVRQAIMPVNLPVLFVWLANSFTGSISAWPLHYIDPAPPPYRYLRLRMLLI